MVAVVLAPDVNPALLTRAGDHDEDQVEERVAHHEHRRRQPPPSRLPGPGQYRRGAETIPEKETPCVPQEDPGLGKVVTEEAGARPCQGELTRGQPIGA